MKFNIKYKDIRYDAERDVYIFDTKHPTTGEDTHIEQPIVSETAYNNVKDQIDAKLADIELLMDTDVEMEINTPFQASVIKNKTVVSEHKYSEATTIS